MAFFGRASRITTGMMVVSSIIVTLFIFMRSGSDDKGIAPAETGMTLESGPFLLEILDIEQTYEGVVVTTLIRNHSDRIVSGAEATLITKDSRGRRLGGETESIAQNELVGLAPNGMLEQVFFFYDGSIDEIATFSFRAAFIEYADI